MIKLHWSVLLIAAVVLFYGSRAYQSHLHHQWAEEAAVALYN